MKIESGAHAQAPQGQHSDVGEWQSAITIQNVSREESTRPSALSRAISAFLSAVLLLGFAMTAEAIPFAYVPNTNANTVTVIDLATNAIVATIPVGTAPSGVAVNAEGTRVYVSNAGGGTVSVINAVTNTVSASITVGSLPRNLILVPNNAVGPELWVANEGSSTITHRHGAEHRQNHVERGTEPARYGPSPPMGCKCWSHRMRGSTSYPSPTVRSNRSCP